MFKGRGIKMAEGKTYSKRRYDCGYCGYSFKDMLNRTRNNASSQVRCGYCKNFLKTWQGEELEQVVVKGHFKSRVEEIVI
jgi:DNA-directed RNA polymerase subunit RPC12/RpoP